MFSFKPDGWCYPKVSKSYFPQKPLRMKRKINYLARNTQIHLGPCLSADKRFLLNSVIILPQLWVMTEQPFPAPRQHTLCSFSPAHVYISTPLSPDRPGAVSKLFCLALRERPISALFMCPFNAPEHNKQWNTLRGDSIRAGDAKQNNKKRAYFFRKVRTSSRPIALRNHRQRVSLKSRGFWFPRTRTFTRATHNITTEHSVNQSSVLFWFPSGSESLEGTR